MSFVPPRDPQGAARRRLLALVDRLSDRDRETVIALAEFLAGRDAPAHPEPPGPPILTPRPAEETVVAAIRRLSASYPMLDRRRLLNSTSSLMAQHILQGRAAAEVIDQLEQAFLAHYQELVDAWQREHGQGGQDPEPL